eukprot:TRINITY_DN4618_c0_g1_i1.p1 TRINITY_DN4618_c0_g1~~TRINITY_DN4618_c0_g1_i1.p1  ORF type:complete len:227 (-),score=33.44 TRINITY_DN4618_c0_g1_i1:25-705(-)
MTDALDKFLVNLKMYHALYSMADLTLFFLPATQLNMVSKQLTILELSLLVSLRGMDQVVRASMGRDEDGSSTPLQRIMKGVGSLFEAAEDGFYKGACCWDKTFFVLTKLDLVTGGTISIRNLFYELGVLFKESFSILPTPVPDSILTLSLPEKARVRTDSDLRTLSDKMKARAAQAPFEKRVEVAIQKMCQELKAATGNSWATYFTRDSTEIENLLARSHERMKLL